MGSHPNQISTPPIRDAKGKGYYWLSSLTPPPATTRFERVNMTLVMGVFLVLKALIWSGVTTTSFLPFFWVPVCCDPVAPVVDTTLSTLVSPSPLFSVGV